MSGRKKGGTRSIFCFVGLKAANVAQVFRICQTLRVFVEPDRHKKTCPTLRMRCLRKRDSWLAKKLVEGLFLCIIAVMVTFSAGIRQIGEEKCILDYIIELNVWLWLSLFPFQAIYKRFQIFETLPNLKHVQFVHIFLTRHSTSRTVFWYLIGCG